MSTEPTPTPQAEPADPAGAAAPEQEVPASEPLDLVEVDEVELAELVATEPYGLLTRLGAEVFGTFALVLVVVGTALYSDVSGLGTLGTALAAGAALAALYAAFAHVSGAHLNPAVSIASALAGRLKAADAAVYVVGQVLAAVAAVAVVRITVPPTLPEAFQLADVPSYLATVANGYGEGSALARISGGQYEFGLVPALLVELVGAAVLAAVVLGSRPSARSAVPVGLAYAAMLMIAVPVTGGGLNPARSTGAAILSLGAEGAVALPQLWLFWVAPLIGGALAGLAKLALGRRELGALGLE